MSRATPSMRDLSQCLIAYETRENKSSETKTQAAFHVTGKLRPHLATFMGGTGFRALVCRALALASTEVTWMRAAQVKADGTLEAWGEIEAQVGPKAMAEGGVVLVARLLGLLVALIGESLTLQIVREVWPTASLNDFILVKEIKNGKTK